MMPHRIIEDRLRRAVQAIVPAADIQSILVRPCPDPAFGDYQTNALMGLAKPHKLNPRKLATEVAAHLDVGDLCAKVEIAGPGFMNFRLGTEAVEAVLRSAARQEHLFFEKSAAPRTVVVDFSSPNVAKPMHVGHLRSTILGDALARTLRLLGHNVITDNHLGDWGTQFGMLLAGWKTILNRDALAADPLSEMERIYKSISARCDPEKPDFDPALRERARAELVSLQSGQEENLAIWREMIRLSQAQFDALYARLGVTFDYALGESFYNPRLSQTVEVLLQRGIATESRGAKAIFSDHSLPPQHDPFVVQREGEWTANPLLVQKTDGGYNYATTDLATLEHRTQVWHADEILYVTDGRQQLHFNQLFAAFRRWHPESRTRLAHVWFGSILGEDGRPFKTRSGETIRLADLLDEAEERALKVVSEKSPELPESQRREIARVVGIGAVKYADLLSNRQSDYVFHWDKLLSLTGNTAPYLQYAYARIRSIFRKGEIAGPASPRPETKIALEAPAELALAKHLLNFGLVLEAVATEYRPNFLCNYLYELSGLFTGFYERCPVLKSEPALRESRLTLCDLTGRVLKQGLNLLGIEVLEQM
jgi:arginyl-tRNA synthetase